MSEIVFFQSGVPRDRSLARAARAGEVQKVKPRTVDEARGVQEVDSVDEAALEALSRDVGELVTLALDAAHIAPAQAARCMGISLSLFLRQLQNADNAHLSMQRLYRLPDSFWRELWVLIAERRRLARVRRRVVFEVPA